MIDVACSCRTRRLSNTLTEAGTSCTFSMRFCAVTSTSSISPSPTASDGLASSPATAVVGVDRRAKRRASPIVIAPDAVNDASSPEPRRSRASAAAGVRSPRISGARLLRTRSDGAVTMTSACRENSSSACESGCATIWKFRVDSLRDVSLACPNDVTSVTIAATTTRIASRMAGTPAIDARAGRCRR